MKNKTYYTFKGQSRYVAKWWVCYTNENGDYHSKPFPLKNERDAFVKELEEQGYSCDKELCNS